MKTHELKKGDKVILKSGLVARIEDERKTNVRRATIYSEPVEIGKVYAWEIAYCVKGLDMVELELTKQQIEAEKTIKRIDNANSKLKKRT